ncbi:MAG: hypothetical protein II025_01770, partial [Ruminococcus sp.]|nr:hypothetical protein [Ruminococcus sp.]
MLANCDSGYIRVRRVDKARTFINRFLYDNGLSPVKEPFKKLVHQGMILGENGIKMGKRFP